MLAALRALLWIDPLIILLTIVMGTLSLAASVFDSTGRRQHRIARAWARMLLRVSGVTLVVEGQHKLDPGSTYVLVANHRSYIDIPAVLAALPLEIRFFAKKGLFSIPFLGTHLRRAGHIPVIRGDARASLKNLHEAATLIRPCGGRPGITPLLFPEGGRSPAAMRAFKEGAAHLAIKAGVPAVPVGIAGTREILPMRSILVRPGVVHVRVGDPIPTATLKSHDRHALNQQLREGVAELMDPRAAPSRR
jgi:1-acyl-sn-glycerol-3-phosphate acyltransferase